MTPDTASIELSSSHSPNAKLLKGLQDIHDFKLMRGKQTKLLLYILATVSFLAVNLALFGLNFRDQEFIEEHYYLPFHVLEFWAVFAFTMIEAFVLLSTNTLPINGTLIQRLQIGIAFFNVLFTFIVAIIFSMDPEEYEVPAHYMEYSVQIPITIINFVFVLNSPVAKNNASILRYRYIEIGLALVTFVVSIFQIVIYAEAIETAMEGERAAHFFEFVLESVNAAFVLWFAGLMYTKLDKDCETHYANMHDYVATV